MLVEDNTKAKPRFCKDPHRYYTWTNKNTNSLEELEFPRYFTNKAQSLAEPLGLQRAVEANKAFPRPQKSLFQDLSSLAPMTQND